MIYLECPVQWVRFSLGPFILCGPVLTWMIKGHLASHSLNATATADEGIKCARCQLPASHPARRCEYIVPSLYYIEYCNYSLWPPWFKMYILCPEDDWEHKWNQIIYICNKRVPVLGTSIILQTCLQSDTNVL